MQPGKIIAVVLGLLWLAQAQPHWKVSGTLLGKGNKPARDISGIACQEAGKFPSRGLVVDDETPFAQLVTLRDGVIEAGAKVLLNDKGEELDGEGVAYADGYFYIIGSHGHPRDRKHKLDPVRDASLIKSSIQACSQILRLPSQGGTVEGSRPLRPLLESQPQLAPFVDRRLDQNGLTVEGLAILNQRLYVGLRGPCLGHQAPLISAALGYFFANQPPLAKLELLPLGQGRGLRDIVAYGDGLLILAGPTGAEDGLYSIGYWSNGKLSWLGDLPDYRDESGERVNPEAIMPLSTAPSPLRVLVLSDGASQGGPKEVTFSHLPGRDTK